MYSLTVCVTVSRMIRVDVATDMVRLPDTQNWKNPFRLVVRKFMLLS